MSFTMWPKWDKEWELFVLCLLSVLCLPLFLYSFFILFVCIYTCCFWSILMSTSESPSKITRSKPASKARTKGRLAVISSTSMVVKESRALSLKETITCPASFLITTPKPALCSESNKASSKFTLYRGLFEGCQLNQ